MHVAFLGFGLIAGSIARAVSANPATSDWTAVAWSPSGHGPSQAVREGIIGAAAVDPETALAGADLVVLAAPATDCLVLIDRLAGAWNTSLPADAVVTDVASTKTSIVERAEDARLRFVGGHPMAGRETAGYDASLADLFIDRPWVVVPSTASAPADVERVARLARACSARVIELDAATHDRAVAGISHLPLIAAAAVVEAVIDGGDVARADWPVAAQLAATGWRDMTRLARGDAAMGAAIVATNATALADRVRDLRDALDAWLVVLDATDGPDQAAVTERLVRARALLERSPVSDEQVFVVPRTAVLDDAGWYGLRTDGVERFVTILEREGRYEPRRLMEVDPAFKQVIPYLVLRDGDRFFLMQRTSAGADARLHGRYSIGVGGHLNPGDGGLLGGLRREWSEELVADFEPEFRLVALLNDDTTEVGSVHLGAVYVADAGGRPVAIRETDKLTGAFETPAAVASVTDRMETWSRLVFEFLVDGDRVAVPLCASLTSMDGAGPIIGARGQPSAVMPDPDGSAED